MIVQYPHILTATITTDAYQDENGNWVPGSTSTRNEICRAEPNSTGRFIIAADGEQIYYSWMVYLPQGVGFIQTGTDITIAWNGDQIVSGKVQRFSNGQLNTRIWL